jgi:hypothetical protein
MPQNRTPSNAKQQSHLQMMAQSFYIPVTSARTVQGNAIVWDDENDSTPILGVKNKRHYQPVQAQNLAENKDQNHSYEYP